MNSTVATSCKSVDVGSPKLLVAVSGSTRSLEVVRYGAQLAAVLGCHWEALHVVTTKTAESARGTYQAADALALAAELGASVARIPAATAIDGICSHLESSPATDIVLGASPSSRVLLLSRGSLAFRFVGRGVPSHIHLLIAGANVATAPGEAENEVSAQHRRADYLQTLAVTVATAVVALLLRRWLSPGALGLLFLFPVIATSARFGPRQGLLAVLLSVFLSNWLLIEPRFELSLKAPQSWVLAFVLILVAIYTGTLTSELRRRVRLSDRSAQENANIAAFALNLTRVSDWNATAELVCTEISNLLEGVQTVLFRQIDGELAPAAAQPSDPIFSPLDMAALKWAWVETGDAGSGTAVLADANWQFRSLNTSLGTLAVLGLAREDGRNPVRADQAVLLSTLLAQAALAHERLLLEDRLRRGGNTAEAN